MKVTAAEVREALTRVRLDVLMRGKLGSGHQDLEDAMSQCEGIGMEIVISMMAQTTLQEVPEDHDGTPSMVRLMENRLLLKSPVMFVLLGYRLALMHAAYPKETQPTEG